MTTLPSPATACWRAPALWPTRSLAQRSWGQGGRPSPSPQDQVPDVPPLRLAARRDAVRLLPVQPLGRVAGEQGVQDRAVVDGEASPFRPAVVGPQELAGEAAARGKRRADAVPEAWERVWGAEEEGEARVDEPAGRQARLLEAPVDRLRRRQAARGGLGAEAGEGVALLVDGRHGPAAAQQLERVAADAAAEVDRVPGGHALGRERVERLEQGRARRPEAGLVVVGAVTGCRVGRGCVMVAFHERYSPQG